MNFSLSERVLIVEGLSFGWTALHGGCFSFCCCVGCSVCCLVVVVPLLDFVEVEAFVVLLLEALRGMFMQQQHKSNKALAAQKTKNKKPTMTTQINNTWNQLLSFDANVCFCYVLLHNLIYIYHKPYIYTFTLYLQYVVVLSSLRAFCYYSCWGEHCCCIVVVAVVVKRIHQIVAKQISKCEHGAANQRYDIQLF